MDKTIVDVLNAFPAGSFLLFLFSVGTLIFTYRKKWKDTKKEISDEGGELALKNKKEEEESNNINLLLTKMNSLEETIEQQNIEMKKYVDNKIKKVQCNVESNNAEIDKIEDQIKGYQMNINKILDSIDNIMKNIHILIDSDKETIRSFIMSEYYKWEGKVIDLITLQNIERLYKKYLEELGDESDDFIDKIMTELRNLPTKH